MKREKQNFSCVYRIVSKANGACYVGSAKHFGIRRRNHQYQLRKKRHHSPLMQAHVDIYGIEDIYFEVLELHPFDEKIRDREQYYMDLLKPSLNKKRNSRGFGDKSSAETIEKLRKSHLGHKPTKEALQKRSQTMKEILSSLTTEERLARTRATRELRKKKIICTDTGISYDSIRDARNKTGSWDIWQVLNGSREKTRNNQTFKYL